MSSRLKSDKVVCGVLKDDYRLPEEESSEKESDMASLSLLGRDYRPAEVETLSNFLTCPLFGTHERKAFQGVWKCTCSLCRR